MAGEFQEHIFERRDFGTEAAHANALARDDVDDVGHEVVSCPANGIGRGSSIIALDRAQPVKPLTDIGIVAGEYDASLGAVPLYQLGGRAYLDDAPMLDDGN